MLYAVIDTNVLASVLLASRKKKLTNPWKVMSYVFFGDVVPVCNSEIVAEYLDVLSRRKFHFEQHIVEKLITEQKRYPEHHCRLFHQ